MTSAVLIFVVFVTAVSKCSAQNPSVRTGDWLAVNGHDRIGARHTIKVSEVTPWSVQGDAQWFNAQTYDRGDWGGWVLVLVPRDKASIFLQRYGTSWQWDASNGVRTETLLGTICKDAKGRIVLLYGGLDCATLERKAGAEDPGAARIWTDTDGRTVEAVYISHDAEMVTIRRTDDEQLYTFPIGRLSQADREFLLEVAK